MNYSEFIGEFAEIVLHIYDADSSGDSYMLLCCDGPSIGAGSGIYGYLCFGWGSCSGCDALQSALYNRRERNSYSEFKELRTKLCDQVVWKPKEELLEWIKSVDWAGKHEGRSSNHKFFREVAIVLLAHDYGKQCDLIHDRSCK